MTNLPDGGRPRPITRWGDPIMHRELEDVVAFDDELATLVADMVATMRAADGVGLAANQVGVDLKVFVFDCPDESGAQHQGVVCNPVLELPEGRDRNLDEGDEGCLSLPGAFQPCARPDFARVNGVDHTGAAVVHEGDGLWAGATPGTLGRYRVEADYDPDPEGDGDDITWTTDDAYRFAPTSIFAGQASTSGASTSSISRPKAAGSNCRCESWPTTPSGFPCRASSRFRARSAGSRNGKRASNSITRSTRPCSTWCVSG